MEMKAQKRYNETMEQTEKTDVIRKVEAQLRRLENIHLQEIEGNPLTEEEMGMFEMFEREGWPHEKRREYIRNLILEEMAPRAAE